MHREISVRLKIFDGFLTCTQSSNLIFDRRDFFDLLFEHFNFLLQEIVLGLLIGDHYLKPPINGTSNHQAKEERRKHRGLKGLFAALTRLLSVGE